MMAAFSASLIAQPVIYVQDTIWENTVWSADTVNTVKVTSDITVMDDVKLSISSGTFVELQDYFGILVHGTLEALGEINDTIRFTVKDTLGFSTQSGDEGSWAGILFEEGGHHIDSSKFLYCRISYVKNEWAIDIQDGHKVVIYGCLLEDFRNSGCNISTNLLGYVRFQKCTLRYISGNATIYNKFRTEGEVDIIQNFIHNNNSRGLNINNKTRVLNNQIINNNGNGIECSASILINNLICNNSGYGIFLEGDEAPCIANNTICNNNIGIMLRKSGPATKPLIINSIVWGNHETQISTNLVFDDKIYPTIRNCIIEWGIDSIRLDSIYEYADNSSTDPMFTTPSIGTGIQADALLADWSLKNGSSGINYGLADPAIFSIPEMDIFGMPRIQNGIIDIGAVENHIQKIEVCGTIPSDIVWVADTILVTCDVYVPDTVNLRISPGSTVLFDGHYQLEVDGRLFAEGAVGDTIIFTVPDTLGFYDNSITDGGWNGIRIQTDSSIFRYCIGQYSKSQGNGFLYALRNSNLVFEHCVIENNKSGGISSSGDGKFTMDHCLIRNNQAWAQYTTSGFGLKVYDSEISIKNSSFINNRTSESLELVSCRDAIVDHCIFAYNLHDGIFIQAGEPSITNCLIHNNKHYGLRYVEDMYDNPPILANNLIANNESGIYIEYYRDALFVNNTIVNNSQNGILGENAVVRFFNNVVYGNGMDQIKIGSLIFYINNCLISGGIDEFYIQTGNVKSYNLVLDADPFFSSQNSQIGPDASFYSLDWMHNALSPCFNTGTNTIPDFELPSADITGLPRIHGGGIDMGAFEHQGGVAQFVQQPIGGVICEGDSIILNVIPNDTVFYQWMKDGAPMDSSGTITLNSVDLFDQGEYRCVISNNYGTVSSDPAYVFVIEKPEFLIHPKSQWVVNDKAVNLYTQIKGTNSQIKWEFNGEIVPGVISSELLISQPDSADEGVYKSIISNNCGSDTSQEAVVYLAPQLCMVTVSPTTGHNLVVWEKKSIAPILAYNIYRESVAAGIYDRLASVPYDDLSVFVDTTADPTVQAYIYKITAIDTAENETDIDLCKPHKTVHLIVSTNPELNTTQLQWDRYYGFGYDTYTIYRSNTGLNFDPVHSLSSNHNSWTDPDPSDGDLYYRIAVDKPVPCDPEGSGKKAGTGPYRHSLSNMDNNKMRAGEMPPDTILLSSYTITEGNAPGALVGKLITEDEDSLDSHTYKFVPGDGDDDNISFSILSDMLLASETYNYFIKNQFKIRIRSTDEAGNYCEVTFVILITPSTGLPGLSSAAVRAFPNPFNQATTISFPNSVGEPYRMVLTDLSGKVCRLEEDIRSSEFVLKRENLNVGLYFIEISGPKVYRGKVVVE